MTMQMYNIDKLYLSDCHRGEKGSHFSCSCSVGRMTCGSTNQRENAELNLETVH